MSKPGEMQHDQLNGRLAPADLNGNGQLATPALSPISEHGEKAEDIALAQHVHNSGLCNSTFHKDGATDAIGFVVEAPIADNGVARVNGVTVMSPRTAIVEASKMLKLSPRQLQDLTSSPGSLPLRPATPVDVDLALPPHGLGISGDSALDESIADGVAPKEDLLPLTAQSVVADAQLKHDFPSIGTTPGAVQSSTQNARPGKASRSVSSPMLHRKMSSTKGPRPAPIKIEHAPSGAPTANLRPIPTYETGIPSPMPTLIPVPPLSLPTYLQLELSSDRPSPLYIHRSSSSDTLYESSQIKFERLLNFLLLPPQLEQILVFGALACLDSWLYTFTILPLRFFKAIAILLQWWVRSAAKEVANLGAFVYQGIGRLWQRLHDDSTASSRRPSVSEGSFSRRPSDIGRTNDSAARPTLKLQTDPIAASQAPRKKSGFRHRRSRSVPSALLPNHKADLLQGALILISCLILMRFDASRMYHSIRGQAAIKLYVIYNVLEVFDRLFSALGQDVLECLFSRETLERGSDGRSKIIRPFWMFILALVYNVIHATALFYQVVTLNVAVNSYSNALLTLLMSNQFVEIKGTVFKKFEKENLFQLTCADVVERFQLWLMLLIIALRNIVEVGGITASFSTVASSTTSGAAANATSMPIISSIVPKAFTLLPRWTGEVLGPFLIVLGSEMIVDWLKHAYINKFNNVKPNIYGRFLDVLAKDYYSHAFADQNLTKRLGLPVIPLSCLFIRASMQTYHMFLATHVPIPIPSTATAIALETETRATSTATMQALEHIDHIFRRALGRSSFGIGVESTSVFSRWSIDDAIALATMIMCFLALYLVLLALKLVLGMVLLNFARSRYVGMKERERESTDTRGRRVGGWGVVEVGEEKRRWIYDDDLDALRDLREREAKGKAKAGGGMDLDRVERYAMAAKRIW
jgi:hypothetical protein